MAQPKSMIPRVTATQFIHFMKSGKTSPALCGCVDILGRSAGEYVVKLRGAVDGNERGLVNELLAAMLATHFGLTVPDAAIITLERQLTNLIEQSHPLLRAVLERSVGFNFGSKHIRGGSTWPIDKAVPGEHFETACRIFAFDALLQNPDRRSCNPNLFTRDEGLILFDHESAFSFLFDVLPQGNPWDVENQRYLSAHVFYRRLKSKPIEMEGFIADLKDLSREVLERGVAQIPVEWDNQIDVSRIVEHLGAVRDHAEEFAESIRRFLR